MNTVTITTVCESDLMQHIEDTPLFSLFRNGRHVKLTWNELTETERRDQVEAARRDGYNANFNPCY